jgi:hypothetical protein
MITGDIELSVFEIEHLIAAGVQIGMQMHVDMMQKGGMLKKREVYRFLKEIGKEPTLLDKLEKDGLIKGERIGKAINSPIVYKKSDLLIALEAIRIKRFINRTRKLNGVN